MSTVWRINLQIFVKRFETFDTDRQRAIVRFNAIERHSKFRASGSTARDAVSSLLKQFAKNV